MQVYSTSVFIQSSVAGKHVPDVFNRLHPCSRPPCRERPCALSRLALNKNRRTWLWLPASLYRLHPWNRLNPAPVKRVLNRTFSSILDIGRRKFRRPEQIRPVQIKKPAIAGFLIIHFQRRLILRRLQSKCSYASVYMTLVASCLVLVD